MTFTSGIFFANRHVGVNSLHGEPGDWGPLHMSPVTGLARLPRRILLFVHMENFSAVDRDAIVLVLCGHVHVDGYRFIINFHQFRCFRWTYIRQIKLWDKIKRLNLKDKNTWWEKLKKITARLARVGKLRGRLWTVPMMFSFHLTSTIFIPLCCP